MLNKQTILGSLFIFGLVLLVLVTIGVVVSPDSWQRHYSAISTVTGEFYVGKMTHFPFSSTIKLTDVFVLQNLKTSETDPGTPQLVPMANSLWSPKAIYFSRKNIIFTGHVGEMSTIATTIRNFKANSASTAPSAN